MTFKEAITGAIPALYYKENRKNYEVAVVDGRTGAHKLGRIDGDAFVYMGMPFTGFDDKTVYDWMHTSRTVLIIL